MSDQLTDDTTADEFRRPRRRWARGVDRPHYLRSEDVDRVLLMMVGLMSEVSSLRDRLDTHEALAEANVVATTDAVEAFELTLERQAAREERREAMLKRVLRPIIHEREAAADSRERGMSVHEAS